MPAPAPAPIVVTPPASYSPPPVVYQTPTTDYPAPTTSHEAPTINQAPGTTYQAPATTTATTTYYPCIPRAPLFWQEATQVAIEWSSDNDA